MEDHTTPSPDAGGTGESSRFRGLHARTYEMELLVSGAVVFGLVKLPPIIAPAFDRFRDGLEGRMLLPVTAAQSYVLFVIYVLVGTFLLHLMLRAYWIGLLGLESVFEHGIRWDKVKLGPAMIRTCHERLGSLARSIDRADDLCSLLFSFGFLIVATFVYSIGLMIVALAVATTSSRLIFDGAHTTTIFWSVLGILVAIQMIPSLLDRHLGARLSPEGAPYRILGRLVAVGYKVSPLPWTGTTQLTLGSNLSSTRVSTIIVVVSVVLAISHLATTLVERDRLRFDDLRYFPINLYEQGIDPSHYRDHPDPSGIDPGMPSIQSRLVTDPYLELLVMYLPRRHNSLILERCPEQAPLRRGGLELGSGTCADTSAVAGAAACLGDLFEARLDGDELTSLHWDFTREPSSGLPAVLATVPVSALPPGRHELEVVLPRHVPTADDPGTERHLIPFWR